MKVVSVYSVALEMRRSSFSHCHGMRFICLSPWECTCCVSDNSFLPYWKTWEHTNSPLTFSTSPHVSSTSSTAISHPPSERKQQPHFTWWFSAVQNTQEVVYLPIGSADNNNNDNISAVRKGHKWIMRVRLPLLESLLDMVWSKADRKPLDKVSAGLPKFWPEVSAAPTNQSFLDYKSAEYLQSWHTVEYPLNSELLGTYLVSVLATHPICSGQHQPDSTCIQVALSGWCHV